MEEMYGGEMGLAYIGAAKDFMTRRMKVDIDAMAKVKILEESIGRKGSGQLSQPSQAQAKPS